MSQELTMSKHLGTAGDIFPSYKCTRLSPSN